MKKFGCLLVMMLCLVATSSAVVQVVTDPGPMKVSGDAKSQQKAANKAAKKEAKAEKKRQKQINKAQKKSAKAYKKKHPSA